MGFVCIFACGENYGVAAVETGGKQMSTGHLYFIFESHYLQRKEKAAPKGAAFLFWGG